MPKLILPKQLLTTALIASLSFAATNTSAAEDLIDASNPEALLEIAKGFGSAQLDVDAHNDPTISGRMDGNKYAIMFYGCENGQNCTEILFSTAWSNSGTTLHDINVWNKDTRFGKAYLDNDGDPSLEMSLNLNHGVSRSNLDDSFEWWQTAVKEFERDVLEQN